eukprot:4239678-Karenia_brevis.AAC.1
MGGRQNTWGTSNISVRCGEAGGSRNIHDRKWERGRFNEGCAAADFRARHGSEARAESSKSENCKAGKGVRIPKKWCEQAAWCKGQSGKKPQRLGSELAS